MKKKETSGSSPSYERLSLLSEIAQMYYVLGLSQNEIANRLHISRSNISRLLSKAKECGIVDIKVHFPSVRCYQLEDGIREKFDLDQVFVYNIDSNDNSLVFDTITHYAAEYIDSLFHEGMSIGVTRGSIFAGILKWLKIQNPRDLDLKLIQLSGAEAEPNPKTDSGDLIREMIRVFNGKAYYLNAPLYVESDTVRDVLEKEPNIHETLTQAAKCDIIITGIGYISDSGDVSYSVWNQYLSKQDISEIVKLKGVGHLFFRIYDVHGNLIKHPVNDRVISVRPESVSNSNVIAIAFGKERFKAVFGALQQHVIKTLFLDRSCAEELLTSFNDLKANLL